MYVHKYIMNKLSNDNLLQVIQKLNISHKNEIKKLKELHFRELEEKEEALILQNDEFFCDEIDYLEYVLASHELLLNTEIDMDNYE